MRNLWRMLFSVACVQLCRFRAWYSSTSRRVMRWFRGRTIGNLASYVISVALMFLLWNLRIPSLSSNVGIPRSSLLDVSFCWRCSRRLLCACLIRLVSAFFISSSVSSPRALTLARINLSAYAVALTRSWSWPNYSGCWVYRHI